MVVSPLRVGRVHQDGTMTDVHPGYTLLDSPPTVAVIQSKPPKVR